MDDSLILYPFQWLIAQLIIRLLYLQFHNHLPENSVQEIYEFPVAACGYPPSHCFSKLNH